jgi:TP901 family phage tail tape measure protein
MSQADLDVTIGGKTTQLERDVEAAGKRIGRKLGINIGKSSKSIDALSQPLGRITGRADEFTKSMEAANARVLAFGASVGVLGAITKGFKDLVTTTISVEKQLTSINTILGGSSSQLDKFSKQIFEVARNTEQSFDVVAQAALELSRQGLNASEVTKRLNDALVLSRLTGQGAAEAVSGLTAAINSFNESGITSSEVLNKLSAAAISAAVSEKDLIEGVKRSGAVAVQAGVSFDELVGVIGAVQEKTARGGAVIGNSFKTIFTRLQSLEKLETMQNLGVQVTDASGAVLSATELIQNLGKTLKDLPKATQLQIAENLVGKFQIAPFLAILEDYNSETSKAIALTKTAQQATTQAYERNEAQNKSLSAILNEVTVNATQLASAMGTLGLDEGLKGAVSWLADKIEWITGLLDKDTGNKGVIGTVKALGRILTGPGLAIAAAIIGKMVINLGKFGVSSLSTFFGINKAAQEQAALQGAIASTLLNNEEVHAAILRIEHSSLSAEQKKLDQTAYFTAALNEQYGIMLKMQGIAARVAPGVAKFQSGRGAFGRGAGGYIPSFAGGYGAEVRDISMGVGGAPPSAKAVTIPNFNFGGGVTGPVVANNSEYIIPNFGGSGGSAIFNQDMVASMGLPAGGRPINAAGGVYKQTEGMQRFRKDKGMIGKDDRFAMITPEAVPWQLGKGRSKTTGEKFHFNVFGYDPANVISKQGEKGLIKGIERTSVRLGNKELDEYRASGINVDKLTAKDLNPGSVAGMAGSVFETAVRATTKQYAKLGKKGNDTFDFFGKQIPSLRGGLYKDLPSSVRFVDAKINAAQADDFATKMSKFGAGKGQNISKAGTKEMLGLFKGESKNKRAETESLFGVAAHRHRAPKQGARKGGYTWNSRGYIPSFSKGFLPNFANGAPTYTGRGGRTLSLNQALAGFGGKEIFADAKRHQAAQDKLTKKLEKSGNAAGGLTMKLMGLQLVTSGLTGAFGDAEDGWQRAVGRVAEGMEKVSAGFLIADVTKDWGKNAKGFSGALGKLGSKLGLIGGVVVGAMGVWKSAKLLWQDLNGTTDRLKVGFAALDDAAKAAGASLNKLSEVEKIQVKKSAEDIVENSVFKGLIREVIFSQGSRGGFAYETGNLVAANEGSKMFASVAVEDLEKDGVKLADKIAEQLALALASGTTVNAVRNAFIEAAKSGNQESVFGEEDLETLAKNLKFLSPENMQKAVQDIDLPKVFRQQGFGGLAREGMKLGEAMDATPEAVGKAMLDDLDRRIEENRKKTDESDRLHKSVSLQRIKHLTEIESLNKHNVLLAGKELSRKQNSLRATKEELIELEFKKSVLENEAEFRNEILKASEAILSKSKLLTKESDDQLALEKIIKKANEDQVITLSEERAIMGATQKLLKGNTKLIDAEVNALLEGVEVSKAKNSEKFKELQLLRLINLERERILQKEKEDLALQRELLDSPFREGQQKLQDRSRRIGLKSAKLGQGPESILEKEATALEKAALAIRKVRVENKMATADLLQQQKGSAAKILAGGGIGMTESDAKKALGGAKSLVDLLTLMEGADKKNKLINQISEFGKSSEDAGVKLKNSGDSAIAFAEATEAATARMGEVLSQDQILSDMSTNLRRGTNAAMVAGRLTNDPAARARALMVAGNRERKAQALDDDNETLYRQILEQELLAGQLIDASQQFAQNIGNAMVDAIAKGQNLGDTLMSAASDFFYMMSKALMQNAVNSIVSGGPGGSGFFGGLFKGMIGYNSGGQVRGGSGSRDDVPALLTGGEFIMNKGAVQNYGAGFMGALNSGSVPKYANGGLFTPGTYGQGSISGSSNLLKFATQSYTGGLQDTFLSGSGLGGLTLEPQSGRLTMFGRKNSPAFQKEQESKRKAFDLFSQQYSKNAEAKKAKEQSSSNLLGSILAFGASAVASHLTGGGLASLFTKGKATGGAVPYSAGIDSVPTMLSGGEFVMNAAATQRLGAGNLAALNSGGGTSGGSGNQIVGKLDELNETIASSNTEINITVNSDGTENTNAGGAPNQQRGLAVKIKDVVRQVIEDEKRLGGSLRMA